MTDDDLVPLRSVAKLCDRSVLRAEACVWRLPSTIRHKPGGEQDHFVRRGDLETWKRAAKAGWLP